ncbi:AcrR family transcriptional regulator [Clostridium pascui]|uniref:TetR/AcrR family transcriptional regulator n=1 Tax=Clostridium pascui TaxID=46609 RepID=UPI0019572234|nr:TetR/AcrR family transcriptional regulator [Clostridium pascui]MBM7871347.1 AcrR family transcriptional regulator [Clostridium pascui]
MSKDSIDKRSIHTKKIIKYTLLDLIKEKGFNEISVTDLTKRANINRGTFYIHYADKYDLLEQVEDELIKEIQEHAQNVDCLDLLNMNIMNKPNPFLIKLLEYIKENAGFIKAILGPKGDPIFRIKLKNLINVNLFEKHLANKYNSQDMLVSKDYFISYVLSAHLGVIMYWLENDIEKSPRDIALVLSKLSMLGPLEVSGLKNAKD